MWENMQNDWQTGNVQSIIIVQPKNLSLYLFYTHLWLAHGLSLMPMSSGWRRARGGSEEEHCTSESHGGEGGQSHVCGQHLHSSVSYCFTSFPLTSCCGAFPFMYTWTVLFLWLVDCSSNQYQCDRGLPFKLLCVSVLPNLVSLG